MKSTIAFIILALSAKASSGQAFNVDFGPTGHSVPGASYGAGSGQAGQWNPGRSGIPLFDVSGNASIAQTFILNGPRGTISVPGAAADDKALIEDAVFGGTILGDNTSAVGIGGLLPGTYKAYVYGWLGPTVSYNGEYQVQDPAGFQAIYQLNYPKTWNGIASTFFVHQFTITNTSQQLVIHLVGQGTDADGRSTVCSGLQIVPVPSPGVAVFPLAALIAARRRR